MRVIRSPAVCVRAVSHLFDTKTRHERKHRIIPRLSASERSFTIDHQCARAADGQCAESSRSSSLWRGGHIKTTSTGSLSESRYSYELRKTSYRSRVLPRLVSFLLHLSFLCYKAILHIRLGHVRASRCHPLVFSTDLLYSLSFSSSIHLTFSISFFVTPYYSQFSLFLPPSRYYWSPCVSSLSVDDVSKHRLEEADVVATVVLSCRSCQKWHISAKYHHHWTSVRISGGSSTAWQPTHVTRLGGAIVSMPCDRQSIENHLPASSRTPPFLAGTLRLDPVVFLAIPSTLLPQVGSGKGIDVRLTTTTTATSCHFVLDARLVYSIATPFLTIYPFRVLATAPNDIWFSSIAIPPLFRQSTPLLLSFYPSLSVPVLTCLLYFFSFGLSFFVVHVIRIDVASVH